MANKTFDARLQLKYDTYANWQANNPVLLAGEVAVTVVPASAGAVQQEPAVLFKVGDGVSTYKQLGFASGLAADVYDWAKAATKPAYNANEITGLADYIAGKVEDTDTQYKLEQDTADKHVLKLSSKALGATDWTVVATITTADTVYDDTELRTLLGSTSVADQIAAAVTTLETKIAAAKKAGDDAQADVDALTAKVGTVAEGKTVVQMIEDAKTAATYDDTALKARVSNNETAIATLNGDATKAGSVAKQVADAVASIVADAPEAYNTLKEISDWISSHANDASAMNTQITTNKNDIATLKALVGTLPESAAATTIVGYIDEAIAGLKIGDYAKAADLTAAVARIATLEGKSHEHANKSVLDGITAAKVTKWDAAQANVIEEIDVNGTKQTVTGKKVNISVPTGGLANKDKVAESDLETALATKLNGKANDADLAAIAKSGNVNDLTQTDGDYLIINCGTSSTVI